MAPVVAFVGTYATELLLVSTAVSAYGQYQSGQDAKKAYDQNAQAYELEAQQIERAGQEEEEAARLELRRLLSSQKALYAKAGVDLNTGSPLTIMAATATAGEEELGRIRTATTESAAAARAGGSLQSLYGSNASSAGSLSAGSTLLTGLTKVK